METTSSSLCYFNLETVDTTVAVSQFISRSDQDRDWTSLQLTYMLKVYFFIQLCKFLSPPIPSVCTFNPTLIFFRLVFTSLPLIGLPPFPSPQSMKWITSRMRPLLLVLISSFPLFLYSEFNVQIPESGFRFFFWSFPFTLTVNRA